MDNQLPDAIDRNRRLLGLALDCRLIYPRKKEKIETILNERLEKKASDGVDDPIDVIDILKQEKVLTDEKADYLLALDAHTATCARDRIFGTLAQANHMASESDIEAALALQQARFRQNQESLRLGQILMDRGIITQADCTAILMTQNRVRNKDLLTAMETLGRSPGEQETINKRFGAIAIKKNLATPEQVGQALRCQKQQADQGEAVRFLGIILEQIAGFGQEDTNAILEEQKLMEIRRLDLLKALYPVKKELKVFKRLNHFFSYRISADGIEAFAWKKADLDAPVPVYEFTIWLKKTGICFGILNDALLTDFIENAPKNQSVLVARGQRPDRPQDQEIQYYFKDRQAAGKTEDDAKNTTEEDPKEKPAMDQAIPVPVAAGELLARIIPGQKGRPGKNVLGHSVYPANPAVRSVYPGRGVTRKGNDFLAVEHGFPNLKNGTTLVIDPVNTLFSTTTLAMNLEEDTQDKYLQTNLVLKGNILPNALVKCRSLCLTGTLAGQVGCQGDITIDGDIGRDPEKAIQTKPEKQAPGTPQEPVLEHTQPASFKAPRAEVLCYGSIKVTRSVVNARIRCAGTFVAINAATKGANICASRGLTLKSAVAGPQSPCVLRAGLPPQDPLLAIDQTLEAKKSERAALKKQDEISSLTQAFQKDAERAAQHLLEQDIYRDLIQIIQGPELYQYEELEDKLAYLRNLPEHSSIKAYFLKIPDTETASNVVSQFLPPANKQSLEETLKQLRTRLDPEPESSDEDLPMPETQRLEVAFKARLDALEKEANQNLEEIIQTEREITTLETARKRLGQTYLKRLSPSDFPVIRIRNKCEQGSIIQGILASFTLEETVYNVRFREVPSTGTSATTMVIEN